MNRWIIIAAVAIGCVASAGIFGSGFLVYGWDPGPIEQYRLSNALANLIGRWSLLVGAVILLCLVPLHYKAYLITLAIVPIPIVVAIFYECAQHPTSHNLWPIELIAWFLVSAFIHFPSAFVRAIYLRVSGVLNSGMWHPEP